MLAGLISLAAANVGDDRATLSNIRVRLQLIRHFKTCTTDIYLHNECAHVGLSIDAPVRVRLKIKSVIEKQCTRSWANVNVVVLAA